VTGEPPSDLEPDGGSHHASQVTSPDHANHEGDERLSAGMFLVCLLIGSAAIGLYIGAHPRLSYVDEVQHYDYLTKVSGGHFVRRGEVLGQRSMRMLSCRGIDIADEEYARFYDQPQELPPCDSENFSPALFPEKGVNHTSVHPPFYYLVTGLLARALRVVTPARSLLTAARLANIFWFAVALSLLWKLMAELGAPIMGKASAALVFATAFPLVQTFGAVGPDAASFAAGAGVVLAAMRYERRSKGGVVMLAVAAAIAVAIKETNVIAIGLALLLLLTRAALKPASATRLVIGGLVMIFAALAVGGAWLAIDSHDARLPTKEIPLIARFQQDSISVDDVTSQLGSMVTPVHDVLPPGDMRIAAVAVHGELLDLMILGLAFAAAVFGARLSPAGPLARSAIVVMILGGPAMVVANRLLLDIYVQIPQRYGFSMVPALVALAAWSARRRWVATALVGIASLGVIALVQIAGTAA
jgi:hypothetical protein